MPPKVTKVERFTLVVPLVERIRGEMQRADIHTWAETEICKVCTDAGVVGWGETITHYTWGRVSNEERVIGKSPFEMLWDDSLGAGLQMALLDAAGKLAGVPVYRLLGTKCRDWCPVSFWDHDMSPEKYADEAKVAASLGYTCMKMKARPWHDVRETMRLMSAATPNHFAIDADWNDFLISVSNAVPVLRELEAAFPKIKIWESPMRMSDASGNRLLRDRIGRAIAHHFGAVPPRTAVEMGVCDGFVIGGGLSRVMADGAFSATVGMPFFLQMVGTGLTTALSLHLGAVLTHAQWPAVNCHELYEHSLLKKRLDVVGGQIRVPEEPGLGVEVDEDAFEKYRTEKPDHTLPRHLIKVTRPCGVTIYFTKHLRQQWSYYAQGNAPLTEWGNRTELIRDDGSTAFDELYRRASESPVVTAA